MDFEGIYEKISGKIFKGSRIVMGKMASFFVFKFEKTIKNILEVAFEGFEIVKEGKWKVILCLKIR